MPAEFSVGARQVDVVVIGAGQAGLSAGYHLQRRGFVPVDRAAAGDRTFLILDAEDGPGGAWQHRWESLRMGTVNGIFELPGHPVPATDPDQPSREVLPRYFGDYEERFALDVRRPVRVRSVRRGSLEPAGTEVADLVVVDSGIGTDTDPTTGTDAGFGREAWAANYVINATGTWTRPFWPYYPGRESFRGRHLHVRDYVSAEEFVGQRVVIVGAGISATQLLEEISQVTDTLWVTRREPVWIGAPESGHFSEAIERVEERTRQGLPPESIIRVTGMHRGPWVDRAEARGVLVRHPMFTRVEPGGVRMPDGTLEQADVILWATGFRPAIRHLAPLRLRTAAGGIRVDAGRATDEPRLFLIGYGPSQSTVGANRAGREAVRAIRADLRATRGR